MEAMESCVKTKTYETYKDSGEYWIGEIPTHWECLKLKHIFTEKKIKHNPSLNCGAISFGKVVEKKDESVPQSTKASYQEVLSGEFLINPLNLNYDLKSLRIALSNLNVVVSSGYIVLRNHLNIDKSYYKWLLHRYDVAYMKLLGSGVRQTINFNHISSSLLAYPPIEEQTAIANFLDDKTAKIDQAIALKQKQIELLKERRQILIQRAVTKGLNPNVKTKYSGIEWIGEIPEHWTVSPLRYLGKTQNGLSKGGEYFGSGYPFVSYGDVYKNIQLPEFVDGLANTTAEEQNQYSIIEGDVLFTRTSETVDEIGMSSTCLSTIKNSTFAGFLIRFRPKKFVFDKQYSKYYFRSHLHRSFLIKEMNLVIRASLSQDLLKRVPVGLPPIEEQKTIAYFLNEVNVKISTAIYFKNQEIEKLKEFKASLVDSVVTGKVKVC